MSYPYQIKSIEQYHTDYKKSIEDPDVFGQRLHLIFNGVKNGIKFWNGILKGQRLNGLLMGN